RASRAFKERDAASAVASQGARRAGPCQAFRPRWNFAARPRAGRPRAANAPGKSVDRSQPVAVALVAPAHDVEVDLLQPSHSRAGTPVSDDPAVDVDHRRNLGARAAEEDLVC